MIEAQPPVNTDTSAEVAEADSIFAQIGIHIDGAKLPLSADISQELSGIADQMRADYVELRTEVSVAMQQEGSPEAETQSFLQTTDLLAWGDAPTWQAVQKDAAEWAKDNQEDVKNWVANAESTIVDLAARYGVQAAILTAGSALVYSFIRSKKYKGAMGTGALTLAVVACSLGGVGTGDAPTASPTVPEVTSTTVATLTPTVSKIENTSTPATSVDTSTPDAIATPDVATIIKWSQQDWANFKWVDNEHNDFQHVTQEGLKAIYAKIQTEADALKLDDSVKPVEIFGYNTIDQTTSVRIQCQFDVSCVFSYPVSVDGPHGIQHLILGRVVGVGADGHNKWMPITLSFDPRVFGNAEGLAWELKDIRALSQASGAQIGIKIKDKMLPQTNPVMNDVQGEQARIGLKDLVFDETLSFVPLNAVNVDPIYY